MHWLDWVILVVPVLFVLGMAAYSRKYVRGVADFLAAGRVAGRYVISVGDMQAGLSVITLIAMCECQFQTGIAVGFWGNLVVPISIFMSLTGYCIYRYRQTKCLSFGQFLELRYNRPLRIIAAAIRTIAEMITNSIGPAVATRFFIYIMDLPLTFKFLGMEVSTFVAIMIIVLAMALFVIWTGGRESYGNLVIIDHGTYVTYYAHLQRITVKDGDKVSRGDRVGTVGSTGTSTGPHLHYEVRVNGSPVNPRRYLP